MWHPDIALNNNYTSLGYSPIVLLQNFKYVNYCVNVLITWNVWQWAQPDALKFIT